MFFITEETKEPVLDFSKATVKVLSFILFKCNINIKMTQYNTLNVKLSNLQLNKLKSAVKNGTGVTLNLSSNTIGDSNDEKDFPHNSLLTNT